MDVGDVVTVVYQGQTGQGIIDAVRGGRAYVRFAVRHAEPWTSIVTGGRVPAGVPLSYCLWLDCDDVTPVPK